MADERLARRRFALRDFVFVVRKREVDAAGVDVERIAEIFHGHRGAFDVPAGAAGADGRLPEMLAGLRRFPQREIARVVLFVLVDVHTRARLHAGDIDFRELAVGGKFRDAVVDRAVARVGEALLLQSFDQRDHVVDVIGGADELFGHLDVQRVDILEKRLDVFFGVLANADACGGGSLDDAIVDVGHVHHLHHAVALRMQEAAQNILKHERAEIPDVREGVDGGAAGVDAHLARMNGLQRLDAVRERVVEVYIGHQRLCAKA